MINPYADLDDKRLMALYQEGEARAFDVIYKKYHKNVYTFMVKRTKNESIAADLCQNAFIKFHRSRDKYDPKYDLLPWLYVLCRNELYDYLKVPKIETIELPMNLAMAETKDDETLGWDILDKLTANEREAIQLRYYAEKDFNEISQKLKTSESNARKLTSRAILKLRDWLKEKKYE